MNFVRFCLAVGVLSFVASFARADTLVLKNGDHLTGTVVSSDGKELTFKTDFAGEIKVKWPTIAEVKSDKPLYVVTPDKKTVSGAVHFVLPQKIGKVKISSDVPLEIVRSAVEMIRNYA